MMAGSGSAQRADEVRDVTRRRIEIFRDAGEDWPFAASLKSITEDTAQEYEGRAVLELIQNGHDAIASDASGRIHVLLKLDGEPALYVANDGAPFGRVNFLSIIRFGQSDKSAGEGIGNKGLGFRSILLLTDHPEVYSRDPDDAADCGFSGYSFRFPAPVEMSGLTDDDQLGRRLAAEVSPFDLPVPAFADDPEVLRFASEGFASVIKLPLRDDLAVAEARRQVDALASAEAPVLLFLSRISRLELEVRSVDGNVSPGPLTRREDPARLRPDLDWVREVDLGSQGRYLLARRPTRPELLRDAIRRSVAGRLVDARWLDWDGEAWVGVALPLDELRAPGTIYTFLPMKEPSPLAAHVHAPFFTKLARGDVALEVPLNDYLMGEIAATCLQLLRALRDGGDHQTVMPLVVDLAAWNPDQRQYLSRACEETGSSLETEQIIPVAGTGGWSSLTDAYTWPPRLGRLSVVTAPALAAVGDPILDPQVGQDRQDSMTKLHRAVLGTEMEPLAKTLAGWVESLAKSLQSARSTGPDTWARFYDDLATAFTGTAAGELRGREVILDQDSRLRPAMGSAREDRRTRQLFFSPSADDEDGGPAAATKLPRPLATRVVFTHPDIPWTITEPVRRRRPGRTFLESSGLVREYRTDQLLAVVRDLLARSPSDSVKAAALEFTCSLYPGLNDSQRALLATIPFSVPTVGGDWRLASETAFSRSWGTDAGTLLERLLLAATDVTPGLLLLRQQLIAGPSSWPVPVADQRQWLSFLRAVGVHDGLPLRRVPVEGRQGYQLRAQYLSPGLGLSPDVAQAWARDVEECWEGGSHPYTQYKFSAAIPVLPGAGEVEALGGDAREIYALLLARGLMTWPGDVFEVKVSRPERRWDLQDAHTWPTPVSSYVRHGQWLPVEGSDDDDAEQVFRCPADAWLSAGGQLPGFVPSVRQQVRTIVTSDPALMRLKAAGIRIWDAPEYCGQVLRQLPEFLASGLVAAHHAAPFRKHYRQAWDHLLDNLDRWPWGKDEAPFVVVTVQGQPRPQLIAQGVSVLVPDEADTAKHALLALTAQPVLLAGAENGQAITGMLTGRHLDIIPTSEVQVEVYGDDLLVTPSPSLPALVAEDRQWIATVVALTAELKSGPFARQSEHSLRQLVERLRKIRIGRAESVRIVVGGEQIEPPRQTTSFPIDDEAAPTVVTWGSPNGVFEELERCAGSIASLIGQPRLAAELQLAFSRLGRESPTPPAAQISDQDLALALQVSESQIRESRDDLRGPLFDVIDRARVVLLYFGNAEIVKSFDGLTRDATRQEAIIAALETWQDILPATPTDLVALCMKHPGLAGLRDALGLDFLRFNDALMHTDPPRPPLRHPERHEQAIARYVEAHRTAIVDRLREAYLPSALHGGNLTAYGQARSLDGITADPDWLEKYADPSEDVVAQQVAAWLAGHGANTDLESQTSMPDLTRLRSRNFTMLDTIAQEAEPRLRAWARKHGSAVPVAWNAPVTGARSALELSYLADFSELTSGQLLGIIADALSWPDQMPRTLELTALGLGPADLLSRDQEANEDRRRRQHERTHLHIDGYEMPVSTEHLSTLADTIAAGLTEDFLAQSGKMTLGPAPSRSSRTGSQGGTGLTIARMQRMSEEQRTAVGLIGEIAARGWLERHYTSVEWVSGYRNIVLGDDAGSDRHGYDFIAHRAAGRRLFFEVKAQEGDTPVIAEFELGETEVAAAQQHRDAYRILLITSALDASSRQILELPGPLGPRGVGRYTLAGHGLRYKCTLTDK
jgi:uncharacterized protein DUF3883